MEINTYRRNVSFVSKQEREVFDSMTKGKSQAQDGIVKIVNEAFPYAYVSEETHIKVLIERQGYTVDEIARELGHKPHRMFVDITIRDSTGTYCIEYDGEQHFKQVGSMTATASALNLNKELDREKSWILSRIGIPLVRIPYDAYVDTSVISDMIDEASIECEKEQHEYYVCDRCGRRFPANMLENGKCKRCLEEIAKEEAAATAESTFDEIDYDADDDYKSKVKEFNRQRRKEARERYKSSPEYQQQKAEAKRRRKEMYREMKAKKKRGEIE